MDLDIGSNRKKKLGQLLCEKAYLDESNLEFALEEQKVAHRRLGEILLDLGYVTQAQLNGTVGDANWYVSDVELSLVAVDDEEVTETLYSYDATNWIPYQNQ